MAETCAIYRAGEENLPWCYEIDILHTFFPFSLDIM